MRRLLPALALCAGLASAWADPSGSGLEAAPEMPKAGMKIDCRQEGPGKSFDDMPSQCLHLRLRTGDIDAGRILANRRDAAAFGPLSRLAQDPKVPPEKRCLALQYLGRLPYDARILDLLGQALRSEELAAAAMEGLSLQGVVGRRALLPFLRRPPAGQSRCAVAVKMIQGFDAGRLPVAPDAEVLEAVQAALGRRDCAPEHERALGVVLQAGALVPAERALPVLARALEAADRGGYAVPEEASRLAMQVFYFLQDQYVEGYAPLLAKLRACRAIREVWGLVDGIPAEAARRRAAAAEAKRRAETPRQSEGEVLRVDGSTPRLLKQ